MRVNKNYNGKTELYLQYAIQLMIDRGEDVLAYEVKNAKYYDRKWLKLQTISKKRLSRLWTGSSNDWCKV